MPARATRPGPRLPSPALSVSFDLELRATVSSWEEAERAAAATASPGLLPVRLGPRTRWWRKRIDWEQGQAVLDDDANWEQ